MCVRLQREASEADPAASAQMITLDIDTFIKLNISDLSGVQLRKIEKECTIPNSAYVDALKFDQYVPSDMPRAYQTFDEVDNQLVLHRGFLDDLKHILHNDCHINWNTTVFDRVGFSWAKSMEDRRYQALAVKRLTKWNNGILVAPTGSGKTNIMIRIIHMLQQPTIILVHRNFLAQQWKTRIKELLGYSCGIIGEGMFKIKNITIAMIPTLYKLPTEVKEKLKSRFGLVIADECHHVPAATWQIVMSMFDAHQIYGCSATPTRKDRMQKILFHTIGPIRHIVSERSTTESGSTLPINVRVVRTDFFGGLANTRKAFTKMVPYLIHDNDRNQLIIAKILENHEEAQLVLSDRIEHLKVLYSLLKKADPYLESEIVYGAVNKQKREEVFDKIRAGTIKVLFASSIADEGLDIPELSRLHLVFPTRNIGRNKQQIGRIRRPSSKKKNAIVYDYFDYKNPTLKSQFVERKSFYRAEGYRLEIPNMPISIGLPRRNRGIA